MNKEAQSVVVGLLGGLLIGITASGKFTSYVRPGFGPLLMIAGVILVIVGVISLATVVRGEVRNDRLAVGTAAEHAHHPPELDAHGHQHDRSRAAWMILA